LVTYEVICTKLSTVCTIFISDYLRSEKMCIYVDFSNLRYLNGTKPRRQFIDWM